MTAAAFSTLVSRTANTLGCDLPAGFVAATEKARSLVEAAASIGAGPAQLHTTVLAALEAGRDVHKDAAISRALLDHQLANAGVGQAARERADRDTTTALCEYADDFLSSWSAAIEPHSHALAEAAAELPPDITAQTAIALGGKALHAWANMTEAALRWHSAVEGAGALCMVARVTLIPRTRAVLMCDPDLERLEEIRRTGESVDAWLLARHGVHLNLPDSLGEVMQRLASLDQQAAAREAAAEAAREHAKAARHKHRVRA